VSEPSPGYLLKLDRGVSHRDSLDEAVKRWLKRERCSAALETDPQTGEHVLRVYVAEQPPIELSLLVGDCVHNMRAALDHIVYQLASNFIESLSDSQAKSVEFPIFSDADRFAQRGLTRLKYIAPAARSLIEEMQPYNGGDWEHLSLLHDLDRIDKHRQLNLSVAASEGFEFDCGKEGRPEMRVLNPPGGPIEGYADLVRFRCVPKVGSKGEMKPNASATFQVALSDGPPAWSVVDQLCEIDSLIRDKVIPPLVPFL